MRRILTGLGIVALVLLGVGLRAYRLDAQALWYDDYNGFICLEATDFSSYWDCVRHTHSEHMPLYFLVEYLWAQCAGTSPAALRWLSILFGAVSIPLLYLLGRDIYGRRAGIVAALCLALSPMHIFHSQGIRPYSLLALLCLISILALVRALRGAGRAWWVVNLAANVLVVWTHLFGGFVFVVEGVFLLARFRHRLRGWLLWMAFHVIVLMSCFGWVYTMPAMPKDAYELYYPPTPFSIFSDLAGDDAVHLNLELLPSPTTWSFLPGKAALALLNVYPLFDYTLVAFWSFCVGWLLWTRVRRPSTDERGEDPAYTALLFLLFLLPALGLAVLSWVWKPCVFPRYTLYSSMALYVMLGGAFEGMHLTLLRRCAWAALVCLYAYQLSLLLPAPVRTEWQEAAAQVRTHASRGDVILAGKFPGAARPSLDIFRWHLGASPLALVPGDSPDDICGKIACYARGGLYVPERRVWVVLEREYAMGSLPELEECLTARGFRWERTDFYAMEGLSVYRVSPDPKLLSPPMSAAAAEIPLPADCSNALTELARAFIETGDHESALRGLNAFIQCEPAAVVVYGHLARVLKNAGDVTKAKGALDLFLEAIRLGDAGDWDRASALMHEAIARDPAYPAPHVVLALRALEQEDAQGCRREMRKAFEADPDGIGRWRTFMVAVLEERDYERARAEAERLKAMGLFFPEEFLNIIREAPNRLK